MLPNEEIVIKIMVISTAKIFFNAMNYYRTIRERCVSNLSKRVCLGLRWYLVLFLAGITMSLSRAPIQG